MKKLIILSWIFLAALTLTTTANAQKQNKNMKLTNQQESIVLLSGLTSSGDIKKLNTELNKALDAGLTVNEIKEILVQMYAYCGFPRSLNAIGSFMKVLEERKAAGKSDSAGKESTPLQDSLDKYERGRQTLEKLSKTPQTKPAPGFGEFAPRIDAFLKEHLFADIFDSDVLSYQQRELATISALAAMPGAASQLESHISMGMNTGLTADQLTVAFSLIGNHISQEQGELAKAALTKVSSKK